MTTTCTWQVCQWLMQEMRHTDSIVFEHFLVEAVAADAQVLVRRAVRKLRAAGLEETRFAPSALL